MLWISRNDENERLLHLLPFRCRSKLLPPQFWSAMIFLWSKSIDTAPGQIFFQIEGATSLQGRFEADSLHLCYIVLIRYEVVSVQNPALEEIFLHWDDKSVAGTTCTGGGSVALMLHIKIRISSALVPSQSFYDSRALTLLPNKHARQIEGVTVLPIGGKISRWQE